MRLTRLSAYFIFRAVCFISISNLPFPSNGQSASLIDGARTPYCQDCIQKFNSKAKEIQYGVYIREDGKIYFSITNLEWFYSVCTGSTDGIAVELMSKEIFGCDRPPTEKLMGSGYTLPTIYRPELNKRLIKDSEGNNMFFIGNVPENLKGRQLEGNVAFIKNGVVCYYTFLTDIPRSGWDYLPMGLFADSLLQSSRLPSGSESSFDNILYTRKIQFEIIFPRNSASYKEKDFQKIYDSLQLNRNIIRHIEIRAFSSVEGSTELNLVLQKARAATVINFLKRRQKLAPKIDITTGENWAEFYGDCEKAGKKDWLKLSTTEIKDLLQVKKVADSLEHLLFRHRKAIVTVYFDPASRLNVIDERKTITEFREAIQNKDLVRAAEIQKAVIDKIADNSLPLAYLDKLEIPGEKYFSTLFNSRETYKLQASLTSEEEALKVFEDAYRLDSNNNKILYNLCALRLRIWQYDTVSLSAGQIKSDIDRLSASNIPIPLIKRMTINYLIRISEIYMAVHDYNRKDEAINFILKHYQQAELDDQDLLSLAVYLSSYARLDDAERIIAPRTLSLTVNENLLFYYINLNLFEPWAPTSQLKQTLLTALSINRFRYCHLFDAIGQGGASFQILSYPYWKNLYCNYCSVPVRKG